MIPYAKNCKGTSSLHRSKYTACIETPQFTVIIGYNVDYPCGYDKCLPISHHKLMNYSFNSRLLNFVKMNHGSNDPFDGSTDPNYGAN